MKQIIHNKKVQGILLFGGVFLLLDYSAGHLLDWLYKNSKSGVAYQENYTFNKTNQDILIFGSSRAAFHFKADLIEQNTGFSTYNAGREGVGIYYHYALLLATLNRYTPKTIVLDLDFRDVYDRGGSFSEEVFLDLAPFYQHITPEFDNYITRKWYDAIRYQSGLFRYNKKFFNILTANIIDKSDIHKGYRPLTGVWDGKEKVLKDDNFKVSAKHINTINMFIEKAFSNKIKLIVCVSPTLKKIPSEFFNFVNQLKSNKRLLVLDVSNDTQFTNEKAFFYDTEHLNDTGATAFSNYISTRIKEFVKE